MKVSVIMPVYNVEEYVSEAIESWLGQTLLEKELICVDDCSIDGSLEIIKQYEKKYENIIVYTMSSNQGAGHARRKAMEFVRGEYVSFLDADDMYCDSSALEILYNVAKQGDCDVSGGLLQVYQNGEITKHPRFRDLFVQGTLWIDLNYYEFQDDYYFVLYLFRKEYLKINNIQFPLLRRYEDPPFLVQALYYANKIRITNVEFYKYRVDHKKTRYDNELIQNILDGCIMNLKFAEKHNLNELFSITINRLNEGQFLEILHKGLKMHDYNFMERLLIIYQLVKKHGFTVEILEYLFYLEKNNDAFNEFILVRKCEKYLIGNKKIILYGAGNIGKNIYSIIEKNHICEIVMWVDHYKAGNIQSGRMLYDVEDMENFLEEYEYVLIGIDNLETSQQVKKNLILHGIDEEIILEWVNI